jgi:microcin C transport system substrate-binding protein
MINSKNKPREAQTMNTRCPRYSNWLLLSAAAFLVSCGGGSEDAENVVSRIDNSQEVLDFYAANPERFRFKTLDDVPANLVWDDGMHLPEIGSPEAIKGGTYYELIADFPPTLRVNGPDSNSSFRGYLSDMVGMMLAHRHPNEFDYYPGIAEAWAISEADNAVYIKLNPEARWTDGEPITVDDMMFTMYFGMSEYINDPWMNNYWTEEIISVTKYDDTTFSYGVPEVRLDVLGKTLEIFPMPRHVFKELGDDFPERYQWRFVPTAGVYEVREENINMGVNIALTKIDSWWASDNKFWQYRFNPDRVNLAVLRDPAKRFEAFRAGDIDQYGIATADYWYDFLPNDDPDVVDGYIYKAQFFNDGPRTNWGLWMNSSRPLLDNWEVRLGIQYASNWDLVLEKYFRGDLLRLKTEKDGFGKFSHPTIEARAFNIETAAEHFSNAGFTRRGADGILVNAEGQRLSFTLSTHYDRYTDVFTILKEEAVKAGLEFRIEMLDAAAGFRKAQEKQHDIYFVGFNIALEPLPRFWEYFHSDNAYDDAFLEDGSINPERKIKPQTNNLQSIADFKIDGFVDRFDDAIEEDELQELAHTLIQLHHDYASYSPGFVQPFYWHSYWNWVKFPEGFNYRYTKSASELFVHWIDEEAKAATLAARRAGQPMEAHVEVFDQYKEQ